TPRSPPGRASGRAGPEPDPATRPDTRPARRLRRRQVDHLVDDRRRAAPGSRQHQAEWPGLPGATRTGPHMDRLATRARATLDRTYCCRTPGRAWSSARPAWRRPARGMHEHHRAAGTAAAGAAAGGRAFPGPAPAAGAGLRAAAQTGAAGTG